jgi:hypothetical protein
LVAANSQEGLVGAAHVRRSVVYRSDGLETLGQDGRADRDNHPPRRGVRAGRRPSSSHRLLYCWMAFTDILAVPAGLVVAFSSASAGAGQRDFILVLPDATALTLAITAVALLSFWSEVWYSRLSVVVPLQATFALLTISRSRSSWA